MSPSTSDPSGQTAITTPTPKISMPKNLSRLTKAELEKKIHYLTEVLQAAQEKETTLQEQVGRLEATVEEQKNSIQDLQTSLTQAQSLQTELEQTRADALKLAQENEQLQAQLQSRKQGTVDLKTPPKQPARQPIARSRTILDRPVMSTRKPNQTGRASKGFDTWCYD